MINPLINLLNGFMLDMAQSTKCGSCKRVVKEGDAGVIGCDKCDGWFHEHVLESLRMLCQLWTAYVDAFGYVVAA